MVKACKHFEPYNYLCYEKEVVENSKKCDFGVFNEIFLSFCTGQRFFELSVCYINMTRSLRPQKYIGMQFFIKCRAILQALDPKIW